MAGISAFRSHEVRDAYCQLYDAALAAAPMAIAESDVETSFGRTHVLTAGDLSNPPLVAVHPLAFSSTSWLPLLSTLAARHRVTMIDAIGDVTKSVASKPITTAAHVVAWLDETLRALTIERAAMVAMSMGTWMTTQYSMAYPGRVDRLALVAPVGLVCGQHLGWTLRGAYANFVRPTRARLESFIDTTATSAGQRRMREDPWRLIVQQCTAGGEAAPTCLRRRGGSERSQECRVDTGAVQFETNFRQSQLWSISRPRSVLFGLGRFGRMRRSPWRRWSSSHPCGRAIRRPVLQGLCVGA